MVTLFGIVLLTFLVVTAIAIVSTPNLFVAVMLMSIFSLLMAATFFALLDLADLNATSPATPEAKGAAKETPAQKEEDSPQKGHGRPALHYNIQLHLPATKDIEVFSAIFKSLKEHLLD